MKISVKIERSGKGRYRAQCPNPPGCFATGDSRAESLNKIDEAIQGYFGEHEQGLFLKTSGRWFVKSSPASMFLIPLKADRVARNPYWSVKQNEKIYRNDKSR